MSSAPPDVAPPPVVSPPRRRLTGVDVARALAIVGMVTVHVLPSQAGEVGGAYGFSYGRASALFAVVAGVGIALSSGRRPAAELRARLLYRALWLVPLGVWLQSLDHPVAVILHYYGLWFALTALVVTWSSRAIARLVAVGVVVGPTVLVAAQVLRPAWYRPPGAGAWLGTFGDVALTGYYPTVSWWWLVLVGLLVGRLALHARRVQAGLVVGGLATSVGTSLVASATDAAVDLGRWQPWLSVEGHADTTPETIAVGGIAVALLGLCLLLADALPDPVLHPLAALGRLALTVYVGHLVLYAAVPSLLGAPDVAEGTTTTLWFAVVTALGSTLWLRWRPRGPLEGLEHAGFRRLVLPAVGAVRGDRHA